MYNFCGNATFTTTIRGWQVLEKLKDKIQNAQIRRSSEKSHHIYETYKNTVMPHGRHIYSKSSDISHVKMCTYPQSDHALPQWKFVLRCCFECTYINLPCQETYKNMKKQHPQLGFTFITSLNVILPNGRIPFKDKTICYICKQ